MKAIYRSQFINEIQHFNTTIKAKIKQTSSFLSKLFSVKNTEKTDGRIGATRQVIRPLHQQPVRAAKPALSAQSDQNKSATTLKPMVSELHFSSHATETRKGSNHRQTKVKRKAPQPPYESGTKRKHQLQTLQLGPQIAVKSPIMVNPVKTPREPIPALTTEMINQLEQILKQTSSTSRTINRRQINPAQLNDKNAEKLKLALQDFALNPEKARDQWLKASQHSAESHSCGNKNHSVK